MHTQTNQGIKMAIENKEAVQTKLESDKMQLLKICNQSSLTHDEIVNLYFDYCTSESEDSRSLLYMMTPRDIFNSVCSGEIKHIHSDTKIDVMIDDYMNNNKDNKMTEQALINANEEMKDKLIATAVRSSNARKQKPTLDDIVEQSIKNARIRSNRYEGTTRKDCKQLGVNSHEPARWVVLLAAVVLIAALYKAAGTNSYYIQDDKYGYILKTDKPGE